MMICIEGLKKVPLKNRESNTPLGLQGVLWNYKDAGLICLQVRLQYLYTDHFYAMTYFEVKSDILFMHLIS